MLGTEKTDKKRKEGMISFPAILFCQRYFYESKIFISLIPHVFSFQPWCICISSRVCVGPSYPSRTFSSLTLLLILFVFNLLGRQLQGRSSLSD